MKVYDRMISALILLDIKNLFIIRQMDRAWLIFKDIDIIDDLSLILDSGSGLPLVHMFLKGVCNVSKFQSY